MNPDQPGPDIDPALDEEPVEEPTTAPDTENESEGETENTDEGGPPYTCEACGVTYSGKNAQQRYASHFRSVDHSDSGRLTAGLMKFRLASRSLLGLADQAGLPNLDAASESKSEYDGAFSWAGEWHAFFFGVAGGLWAAHDQQTAVPVLVGLVALAFGVEAAGRATKRVPDYIRRHIQQEVHYFIGGVLVGWALIMYLHGDAPVNLPTDWLPFGEHDH